MTALPPGAEVEVVTWGDVRVGDWVAHGGGFARVEIVTGAGAGAVMVGHSADHVAIWGRRDIPCRRLIPSASSRVLDAAQATIAELRAELAKYKNESEPWEQT